MPQSHSKILIHLVFSTKHRAPFITPEIQDELHFYITGVLTNLACQPIQVGGTDDHIHIFFAISRTITIASVAEKIKTATSKWIKTKSHRFVDFHWQSGYSAFSVGQSGLNDVVEYIKNQREHHHKMTFQEEYRKLLQKYEIDFDENYLWD